MKLLLGFLPFAIFTIAERLLSPTPALALAAAVAIVQVLRSRAARQSAKVLDVGACALFGLLALYSLAMHASWSILDVRLRVDAGMFIVVALSMAIGRPFTLQYARESAPPEVWRSPRFIHKNMLITGVWAAAFAAMTAIDCAMLSGLAAWIGIVGTLCTLGAAMFYTTIAKRSARAR
ncbi:MAG: hypothetical protein ABI035_03470 [Gemmatimonadaceae bacterium]